MEQLISQNAFFETVWKKFFWLMRKQASVDLIGLCACFRCNVTQKSNNQINFLQALTKCLIHGLLLKIFPQAANRIVFIYVNFVFVAIFYHSTAVR